jgi:hypothetical protein
MRIIEEFGAKIVLVNEAEKSMALIWKCVLLPVGGLVLVGSVYAAGLTPNAELYRSLFESGRVDTMSLLIGLAAALFCFVYAFRFTYVYVTLDLAKGEIHIDRVRFFSPKTVKVIGFTDVRRATVGIKEDMNRLEFELESGEVFVPSLAYTDCYSLSVMQGVVEKINRYLGKGVRVSGR